MDALSLHQVPLKNKKQPQTQAEKSRHNNQKGLHSYNTSTTARRENNIRQMINARAYTAGRNIVFGGGWFHHAQSQGIGFWHMSSRIKKMSLQNAL
jgi:hypothetical protein